MSNRSKAPSQRQLKVGEEVRKTLSMAFLRGEVHVAGVENASITVSEVRVSPDMKNATAYVMPLAGEKAEELVRELYDNAPYIRKIIAKKVELRYTPKLHFKLDRSFEEAGRINELLQDPHVRQDVS